MYSVDYRSGEYLYESGVSNLMALYAAKISREKAAQLEKIITSPEYWPKYGVATTPTNSPYYSERRFWQGPIWINMNWLLREGARLNGLDALAERLRMTTIELIADGRKQDDSIFENYSAKSAAPGGTRDFSWSSALLIDLVNE